MKTPSSIYSPVIDIKISNNSIVDYNYAYISDLKRYYFITNTVYSMGIWTLFMTVDLLASFREDVRFSDQYVIRSASRCDPQIIDTMYMTKRSTDADKMFWRSDPFTSAGRYDTVNGTWGSSSPFNKNINDGYYSVGVVGSTNTGVTYYMMSSTVFKTFLQKAFSLTPSNMTDLESGTASALFNIVQYITSCTWFPIAPLTSNVGTSVSSVTIGPENIPGVNCVMMNGVAIEKFRYTDPDGIQNHPQYDASTTRYLKYSPYTEVGLYFQPFGTIPIDTTKVDDVISVYWYVDYCQGIATLELHNGTDEDDPLIYTTTAEYGVPIPVSTLTYDWKGALAIGAANWIKTGIENMAGSAYTTHTSSSGQTHGGKGGSFGSNTEITASSIMDELTSAIGNTSRWLVDNGTIDIMNKAIDVAGSTFGQVHTVGAQGSFLAYCMDLPYFFAWYSLVTDYDAARFGRPLYKQVSLGGLNGYCLCANASVEYTHANPLSVERRDIEAMLNSGVFLE